MKMPWLQSARAQFVQQFQSGRQAHALLLCGPAGLGKLELAQEMAAALLCLRPPELAADPNALPAQLSCGQCRSCQLVHGGAHPDYRFLSFIPRKDSEELRTVIVIEQVRELIGSMQLTNGLSPRKVAIIYPAEAMNRSAANAILKTLEEPAGDAVLILVSNDASRLSATIRSRCQAISVRPPPLGEAHDWLQQETGADPESSLLALQASAGSPLQAAELLAQGRTEEFALLVGNLQRISDDSEWVGGAMEQLSKLEATDLWKWLAIASAEQIRGCYGLNAASRISGDKRGGSTLAEIRRLSALYSQANRNKRLLSSSVRKDLLLRDWLIQWSLPTSS